MKNMTEKQQFDILYSILSEAKEKANFNDNGKVKVEMHIKTDENSDTEIFIRKGLLQIFAFRVYGENTFYERWRNYPNVIFSKEGLLKELITLIR